jgi:hypothetical protein
LIIADCPEDCQFVETSKGYALIDNEGHKYYRDSIQGTRFGWKCTQYYQSHCKARVTSIKNVIVKKSKKRHNHFPKKDAENASAGPLE